MPKEISNKEMEDRLVEAGWSRKEAKDEVKKMLADAEEEDGYDGP